MDQTKEKIKAIFERWAELCWNERAYIATGEYYPGQIQLEDIKKAAEELGLDIDLDKTKR